jgi:hypothetical protein
MLDHADAGDAVELVGQVAVIGQLETHLVGHACFCGALIGELHLIGGQ